MHLIAYSFRTEVAAPIHLFSKHRSCGHRHAFREQTVARFIFLVLSGLSDLAIVVRREKVHYIKE